MSLELRPPTQTDYAEIATWVTDAEACKTWAGADFPFPFLAAELGLLLDVERRPSFCLIGEHRPTLGFCQYGMRTSTVVHLSRIIVSPKERWKGLAVLMCSMILEKAFKDTNAVAASLRVYRENHPAIAAYTKLGFEPIDDGSNAETLFMVVQRRFS